MNIPITVLVNDDGSYTVVSNAFSFVTEGETLEEALENAKEAAECHIEGLQKSNDAYEKEYLKNIDRSLNTFVTV